MWNSQFGREVVLGTRHKWPRLRRQPSETRPRRGQFWYVSGPSRDRDVKTKTTTLFIRAPALDHFPWRPPASVKDRATGGHMLSLHSI